MSLPVKYSDVCRISEVRGLKWEPSRTTRNRRGSEISSLASTRSDWNTRVRLQVRTFLHSCRSMTKRHSNRHYLIFGVLSVVLGVCFVIVGIAFLLIRIWYPAEAEVIQSSTKTQTIATANSEPATTTQATAKSGTFATLTSEYTYV